MPLQSIFLGMDLGQPPGLPQWWSYLLPILVFATSWVQQKLLTPPTTSSNDTPSQSAMMSQQMQIMMPLMFGIFSLQFSTGLSIYFIVSNLIRVAQYYLIRPRSARQEARSGKQLASKKTKS